LVRLISSSGRSIANVRRRLAEKQPESFEFTQQNKAWLEKQIAKYPDGRQASAVVPALWQAQKQNDYWLPRAAIEKVADTLGMPHIRVLEIATFYTMFNLEPVGKYYVQLCGTTPCMLRGSDDIIKVLERRVGRSARSRRTGCSHGSKSNASAPAATRRWCKSTMISTRI